MSINNADNLNATFVAIGRDIKRLTQANGLLWSDYVLNYVQVGEAEIRDGGELMTLRRGDETVYRFVSDDGETDAVYSDNSMQNLLAKRGA